MSPADLSSRHSAPSVTFQPSEMVFFLKFRQPSVVLPSNKSFQPSAFSWSVKVFRFGKTLAGWSSAASARKPEANGNKREEQARMQ